MSDIFIKEIKINKVRHLENLTIALSETDRKHLILTGKNGSGKTSVLEAIAIYLKSIQDRNIFLIQVREDELNIYQQKIDDYEKRIASAFYEIERIDLENSLDEYINRSKNELEQIKSFLNNYCDVNISFNEYQTIISEFLDGTLILCFFQARRTPYFNYSNILEAVKFKQRYGINEKANIQDNDPTSSAFIKYLIDLKRTRSFSEKAKDDHTVNKIDDWFKRFVESLKEIFEDNELELQYDEQNFKFNIKQKNRNLFEFNTLSDGFSSIMEIVSELILRMENKTVKIYDLQGIVLIDEIEAHLHISLQKNILPFLTKIFPKIQFIVTTHSPFILNSLDNAVIYDLENKIWAENFSAYSVNGIIEGYFDSDNYSKIMKTMVNNYEELKARKDLDEEEKEKLNKLQDYFKNYLAVMSPELLLKIQQIELEGIK